MKIEVDYMEEVKKLAEELGLKFSDDELREFAVAYRAEFRRIVTGRNAERFIEHAHNVARHFVKQYMLERRS